MDLHRRCRGVSVIAPVQYAHVPPAHLLGGLSVRCSRCSTVLRPGQPRAVQIEPSGAVRCVVCPVSRVAPEPEARKWARMAS